MDLSDLPIAMADDAVFDIEMQVLGTNLRALVGKREEKRSLGTRDPAEAKVRHAQLITELDAQWQNLRAGPRALSEREASEIAAPIYGQHIDRYSSREECDPLVSALHASRRLENGGGPPQRRVGAAL